jgi:prepilin-type N-terminal cleavage/methylation domain-containing protein
MHTRSTSRARPQAARTDSGFTLIEVIIVVVIVGILLGIFMFTMGSGKRAGAHSQAVTVAKSYQEAVEQFQSDHGGRVPKSIGDVEDWPVAEKGPVLTWGTEKRPYLKSGPPEAVSDKTVGVGDASVGNAYITYEATPAGDTPTSYTITVFSGKDKGKPSCLLRRSGSGDPDPSGPPSCS